MNERITQLYEQALVAAGKEKQFDATNLDVAEKFAELIVKECIEKALEKRVDKDLIGHDPGIVYLRGINGGIVDAVSAIKQHFRIEE